MAISSFWHFLICYVVNLMTSTSLGNALLCLMHLLPSSLQKQATCCGFIGSISYSRKRDSSLSAENDSSELSDALAPNPVPETSSISNGFLFVVYLSISRSESTFSWPLAIELRLSDLFERYVDG